MNRLIRSVAVFVAVLASSAGTVLAQDSGERAELLKVREAVWIAWFNHDVKTLEKLVPEDTIVISSGEEKWKGQKDVLQKSAEFRAKGGKLIRLEFPRTEVQLFGDFAVTYSKYLLELEIGGKRSIESGRVTETFVRRNGEWSNPGWHTDSEK